MMGKTVGVHRLNDIGYSFNEIADLLEARFLKEVKE